MSNKSMLTTALAVIEAAEELEAELSERATKVTRYLGNNKELLDTLVDEHKIALWDVYLPQICTDAKISSLNSPDRIQISWDGFYSSTQSHEDSSYTISLDTFLELEEVASSK